MLLLALKNEYELASHTNARYGIVPFLCRTEKHSELPNAKEHICSFYRMVHSWHSWIPHTPVLSPLF